MPARSDRAIAIRLAALTFIALSALGHHTWGTVDAIQRLALTRSLLTAASVRTPEFGPIKYGPLQSLLMLPTYAAGFAAGTLGAGDPHRLGYRVTAFLFSPLLTSALVACWFLLARRRGATVQVAGAGAWTLLWSTLLLPYSRLLFSEPLTALLLTAAFLAYLPAPNATAPRPGGFAFLGAAGLNYAIFLPLLGLATVALPWRAARVSGRAARRLLFSGVSASAVTLLSWALYNEARYGSVTAFGYTGETFSTPLLRGLYGLLLSPGRGLVYYSLPSAIALAFLTYDFVRAPRSSAPADRAVLGVFTSYLVLYSFWGSFEGGWCWGPRFLLPFLPLLHLALLRSPVSPRRFPSRLLALSLCVGFLVNAWEYSSEWQAYEKATFGDGTISYLQSVFDLHFVSALHGFAGWTTVTRLLQFVFVAGVTSIGAWHTFRERRSGNP